MRAWILLVAALLLAGCIEGQPAHAPSTPTVAPPPDHPDVRITMTSSRTRMHAGEAVDFTITLTNRGAASIWTNPSFTCSGTWDLQMFDAHNEQMRVDDRDSMGCPSGGPLTHEVPPGGEVTAVYPWDGWARPGLGQREAPPSGSYQVIGRAAWATNATSQADLWANTTVLLMIQ